MKEDVECINTTSLTCLPGLASSQHFKCRSSKLATPGETLCKDTYSLFGLSELLNDLDKFWLDYFLFDVTCAARSLGVSSGYKIDACFICHRTYS